LVEIVFENRHYKAARRGRKEENCDVWST
jgi:hypothetical protein